MYFYTPNQNCNRIENSLIHLHLQSVILFWLKLFPCRSDTSKTNTSILMDKNIKQTVEMKMILN